MSNDTLNISPEVKDYLLKKESNLRSKYFKKYRFMRTELALVMLFQSEAMKHLRMTFRITNTEFKILCAARMYKVSQKALFRPSQLRVYLPGMWMEQVYKACRTLAHKGFLEAVHSGGHTAYRISSKGDNCLKSYSKVFDEVFYKHIQGLE